MVSFESVSLRSLFGAHDPREKGKNGTRDFSLEYSIYTYSGLFRTYMHAYAIAGKKARVLPRRKANIVTELLSYKVQRELN